MKKALVFLICLLLTLPACAESCYISEDMPALEITCGIVGEQALDEFFQPVILQFALTDTRSKATIRFTPEGHQEIHRLCADRHTRRALCRFFRDNLNYGDDETINLTRDSWTGGFYFFSPDTGMEGGVILHETEIKGRDGKAHRKVFFGLHT